MKRTAAVITILFGIVSQGCSDKTEAPSQPNIGASFTMQIPSELKNEGVQVKTCALDSINGKPASEKGGWLIKRSQGAVLSGWLYDSSSLSDNGNLYILLDGGGKKYYALSTTKYPRDDVSKAINSPINFKLGFEMRASTNQVDAGSYHVALAQPGNKNPVSCTIPGTLTIE